jgi:hypothetical protein
MTIPALDALPDAAIASREGMTNDQLFRARLSFALEQSRSLFGQVQFADAKAGTLLALVGLLAAHVASGGVGAGAWEMRGLLLLDGAVIGLCVLVLLPRTAPRAVRRTMAQTDRYSWPALAAEGYGSEEHADFVRTAQASQLVVSVGRSNAAVAHILAVKYGLLRWAFALAFADVVATLLVAGLR